MQQSPPADVETSDGARLHTQGTHIPYVRILPSDLRFTEVMQYYNDTIPFRCFRVVALSSLGYPDSVR